MKKMISGVQISRGPPGGLAGMFRCFGPGRERERKNNGSFDESAGDQGMKKVFIVDDDESVCRALKCLLKTFRFSVETFLSGKEFFSAVTDVEPGCLVLDINMPGLDGWEVQKRLAAEGSKRQFIIITADKDNARKERALEAGAVGFLQKPFDHLELVDLIKKSFEQRGI